MKHKWVYVIVAPATAREAERFLAGQRRTFRKLDLADAETVRSARIMCAACKLAPQSAVACDTACSGEPLPGTSHG